MGVDLKFHEHVHLLLKVRRFHVFGLRTSPASDRHLCVYVCVCMRACVCVRVRVYVFTRVRVRERLR